MHSLKAIELDPALKQLPRDEIVIVGSMTLGLYKGLVGMPKEEHYVPIGDLDACVAPAVYRELLYPDSCTKEDATPKESRWVRNSYRNVDTLRRSHMVEGLRKPVRLDIGTIVHTWTHTEVRRDALNIDGYSLLHPLRQLAWYEALRRKKDAEKIEKLRIIIPKLWETVALTVPRGLGGLASDVLASE